MRKTHTKFFNKLNQFSEKPVDYWNHYDLLGYFCQQTGMEIKLIENEPPSWHPQIQLMNRLIAQLKNPKLILKLGPKDDYDSVYTKKFLDFWIEVARRKNVKLTSVGYIAKNERCYNIFRQDPDFKPKEKNQETVDVKELQKTLFSTRNIDLSDYFDLCA